MFSFDEESALVADESSEADLPVVSDSGLSAPLWDFGGLLAASFFGAGFPDSIESSSAKASLKGSLDSGGGVGAAGFGLATAAGFALGDGAALGAAAGADGGAAGAAGIGYLMGCVFLVLEASSPV